MSGEIPKVDLSSYALAQLGHTYSRIAADQEMRSKIKNWCITVWIGTIVALNSPAIKATGPTKLWALLLPIAFFWAHDALYQGYISGHASHAAQLEEMLVGLGPMTAETLRSASLESGVIRGSFIWRFTRFLRWMLFFANVTGFYGLLIVVSFAITVLLDH